MKIGFIDYYLDEWHANNYPEFFKTRSNGEFEVVCAYGKIDNPHGGMTNLEWSKKYNVPLVDTIEEVIEKSDVLIVLSPDNPEMHEELVKLPLKSGKLTYIDKTFAPDRATAERIFAYAKENGTKCFSSSALRFSKELDDIDTSDIHKLYSEGSGTYEIYSIHQIEPIIRLMNCRAKEVMFLGDEDHPAMLIKFEDGRFAHMYHRRHPEYNFKMTIVKKDTNAIEVPIYSKYFDAFIDSVIEFFKTGVVPVESEQTIDVIAVREAGLRAMKKPFEWVQV